VELPDRRRSPLTDDAAARGRVGRHIEGRVADAVVVSGHLKRQRFGESRALVKWIYVAGYSARRWFAPRWDVSKRDQAS
jgi:hypothetical protein